MTRILSFYTDGAYSSKSQMGGWASICLENEMIIDEQKGYEPYSTNNRCELLAFLSAIEKSNTITDTDVKIFIYTDSAYIANCFNQGWYRSWLKNGWKTADRQDVKNQDLWKRIISLYIKLRERFNLEVIHVKGHAGNKWNQYVDLLAVKMRKELE